MKTLFACTFALAVTTAAIGWADHAAADEPVVLTEAQLDQVTAGGVVMVIIPTDIREVIIPTDIQGTITVGTQIDLTLPNGRQLLLPAGQK